MNEKLIRVYQKLDSSKIKSQLMIYGDLAGTCANCNKIDLKITMATCPDCQAAFKYYAFRNIKVHLPKIMKLIEENPVAVIVDFEDYKSNLGASKALDFLK